MTRTYKLYGTTIGTSDAIASLRITRRGQITGILFACAGIAGGAATGCIQLEVSKQSTRSIVTNDTPPDVIGQVVLPASIASAPCAINVFVALDHPVDVGDTLYLHQVALGQALSSATHAISIYVQQS